jgi:hypothetical protein
MPTNKEVFEQGHELFSHPCDWNPETDKTESNACVESCWSIPSDDTGTCYYIYISFDGKKVYNPNDEAVTSDEYMENN